MSEQHISCREAIEQLWAFIDGELPAEAATRVHDHLEACAACHPQHDYQRAFREFLRRHAPCHVPPRLRRRVFLRLLADEGVDASEPEA
jgi:anti-sigma factor (TIGR02949 family)